MQFRSKLSWYPHSKEERRLLLKLDWFILSFCCLMYWANYLDRANLNNAYVSGMKQDLNFKGKQLNVINTVFYGGYLFGQIPNNLALQKLPPRIYFPCAMLAWGLLTLGTGFVHNVTSIMVIRFFQAAIEASTFVGTHYVLGSWYKREEIGKRAAVFTSSGLAGSMFSGFLQGGIHRSLDGKHGLAGWRWLFIIDFLITVPIAIYGFWAFPDLPSTTRAPYLTPTERQLASSRLRQPSKPRGSLGLTLFKRVLLSWEFYAFSAVWVFASNTEMYSTNAILNLFLASTHRYTIEQVNYIPTGVFGVGIIATIVLGWYSDITKARWHAGVFLSFTAIISGAIMLRPPSFGAKLFALFLNGCQFAGQTLFFAWVNEVCWDDDAKRAVVIASMQTFSIAVYLFWSLLFYNTTQAPNWWKGSVAMICMGVALLLNVLVIAYIERMRNRKDGGKEDGVMKEKVDVETAALKD